MGVAQYKKPRSEKSYKYSWISHDIKPVEVFIVGIRHKALVTTTTYPNGRNAVNKNSGSIKCLLVTDNIHKKPFFVELDAFGLPYNVRNSRKLIELNEGK